MNLFPLKRKECQEFIAKHHRHFAKAPAGDVFRIGLEVESELIGVIMVGRPVSRHLDDGVTLEINRCCILEGYKNASSRLMGAAIRVAASLGYKKLITYTLQIESGSSLRAVGFVEEKKIKGELWNRNPVQESLFQEYEKIRWVKLLKA